MKRIIILLITIISLTNISLASGDIVLEGIFQGKNLYVMNPFASSGIGFCVYEVTINGQVSTDEINSSAFEIDLSLFQFKIGDKIKIEIKHKENCTPKVLNAEVLKPKSTFTVASMNIDDDKTLKWTTKGEAGSLPYVIEQYRWNKWIKVGEVEGKGTPGINSYSIEVHPHSGNNKFRVKQVDFSKTPHYSEELTYKAKVPPVSFNPKKVDNEITFTSDTQYEIYDYYGNIVKKGFGSKIDCSGMKSGDYFLNFDNQMETFKKK